MFFGKKKDTSAGNSKGGSFDKIYRKAASSYKADKMQELEAYCSENPAPWYAYFLLAAAYDCNACGMPFDMGKAEHYYNLAEQAVKPMTSSAALSFFNMFMEYRNYEPGNILVDLSPLTRQIRRTGLAAVATNIAPAYLHYNKTMEEGNTPESQIETREIARNNGYELIYPSPVQWYKFFDTIPHQYKIFGKNTVQDIELEHTIVPLNDYFIHYTSTINTDKDDYKNIKQLIKDHKNMRNLINQSKDETFANDLGESIYDDYKFLILGKAMELAKSCPFDYVQLSAQPEPFEPYKLGWRYLNMAVELGSAAAAQDLAVFLATEYWSNQFSEFKYGLVKTAGLTNSEILGRELLYLLGVPLKKASLTGSQHAFKTSNDAINFCFQYFAPFGDHDTLAEIMNVSGWPMALLSSDAAKYVKN